MTNEEMQREIHDAIVAASPSPVIVTRESKKNRKKRMKRAKALNKFLKKMRDFYQKSAKTSFRIG